MPPRRFDPANYNLFILAVLAAVAVGFFLVWWLRRDAEEDLTPATDDELLREFERAYYSGEMEEAEFRRVTDALKARKAGIAKAATPPFVPPDPPVPNLPPAIDTPAAPPDAPPEA